MVYHACPVKLDIIVFEFFKVRYLHSKIGVAEFKLERAAYWIGSHELRPLVHHPSLGFVSS